MFRFNCTKISHGTCLCLMIYSYKDVSCFVYCVVGGHSVIVWFACHSAEFARIQKRIGRYWSRRGRRRGLGIDSVAKGIVGHQRRCPTTCIVVVSMKQCPSISKESRVGRNLITLVEGFAIISWKNTYQAVPVPVPPTWLLSNRSASIDGCVSY